MCSSDLHIDRNPASSAEGVDVDETDVGETLPREKFASFLAGFKEHPLESVVTVALHTGARLNEILAVRHSDIDDKKGVLRIAQAVERTKAYGTRFKTPKSGKGRELTIDANLLALFRREREALARLIAGVPEGAGGPASDPTVGPGHARRLARCAHAAARPGGGMTSEREA